MLYSSIVKKRIRQSFDEVNDRRWDELMTSIAPRVHHRFGGVHAIGGERHDREALRLWFERLARVLPNLRLEINDIWVKGPPWRTMVFVQWDGTATLLNGGGYFQHAMHVITLRWGKIAALDVFEDSQEVARALAVQADSRPRRGRRRADPELVRCQGDEMPRIESDGEQRSDRDPLRGPRQRRSRRDGARVPAGRELVGAPGTGAAGERLPRDHLRPEGIRPFEPADRRLRLQHLRGRPERPARASRPPRRRPRRVLDGVGRGDALPRDVRLQSGAEGRAARRDPPVPAEDRRQPGGRRPTGVRGHQGGDRQGPLRVLQGLLRQLLQRRQAHARPDQRARLAGQLRRRRRQLAVRDVRVRGHLADRLPARSAEDRRAGAGRPWHGGQDPPVRRRPRRACRRCSTTSSWSRSRAARTTSPGRIRTRSTRRCSSSSPRPVDADGGPAPSGGRGRRRLRWPPSHQIPSESRRRHHARRPHEPPSLSTAALPGRDRNPVGRTGRTAAPRNPAQAGERPRRAGRGHRLRSRESGRSSASGRLERRAPSLTTA